MVAIFVLHYKYITVPWSCTVSRRYLRGRTWRGTSPGSVSLSSATTRPHSVLQRTVFV